MTRFAGCLAAHLLLALALPSPWWVPNLTCIGLVRAVADEPRRWYLYGVVAGMLTALWAVRVPGQLVVGFLLAAAAVRWLGRHWDLTDTRVQELLVVGGSALLSFGLLWLEPAWSPVLFGLALGQVAVTWAAYRLSHRLIPRPA